MLSLAIYLLNIRLYAEFGEGPFVRSVLSARCSAVPLACSLFVCPSALFLAKSILASLLSLPALNEGRIIQSPVGTRGGRQGRGLRGDLIALIIFSLIHLGYDANNCCALSEQGRRGGDS